MSVTYKSSGTDTTVVLVEKAAASKHLNGSFFYKLQPTGAFPKSAAAIDQYTVTGYKYSFVVTYETTNGTATYTVNVPE